MERSKFVGPHAIGAEDTECVEWFMPDLMVAVTRSLTLTRRRRCQRPLRLNTFAESEAFPDNRRPVTPEQVFLDHLPLLEQVVQFIARRHRLNQDESEELLSSVKLKIVESDYAVLRRFRGDSSMKTYLCCVIQRHFLDQRNAQWGRWRPAACARRFGPAGVFLDQLVTREGYELDEAIANVRARFPDGPSTAELRRLSAMLPLRLPRRFVGDAVLADMPASPDPELPDPGAQRMVEAALSTALAGLNVEERTILRLRFHNDLQVSQIARLLGVDQKPLYRKVEGVLHRLRTSMEAVGVTRDDVMALIADPATFTLSADPSGERSAGGPSLY